MRNQIVVGIALLVCAPGCDAGEDKQAQTTSAETSAPEPAPDNATKPEPVKPASGDAASNKIAAADPQRAIAPIPGSLRLVVIHPDPAIVRKRKKRQDSKQDIKQRAKRLERQKKRLAALEASLGAGQTVTAEQANDAERAFAARLVLGAASELSLPESWNRSQRVLLVEIAAGTDATERSIGGFVRTGTTKIALFHPPDKQPSYLEIASKGLLIDTQEVLSIVEETAR
jgi:glucose/arabinose dehydrogenase